MFRIEITPRAKAVLDDRLSASGSPCPGLLVHRAAPAEARSAFMCQVASFETYPEDELLLVDGVRVFLLAVPRPHEKGVRIECRNGSIRAEPLR